MAYTKNQMIEVTIEDIGVDGEGIGHIDGYTFFIKDAVIGDTVSAKIMKATKSYAYARLEKVITPSPFHVSPKCDIARSCGGCQIQRRTRPSLRRAHRDLCAAQGGDEDRLGGCARGHQEHL